MEIFKNDTLFRLVQESIYPSGFWGDQKQDFNLATVKPYKPSCTNTASATVSCILRLFQQPDLKQSPNAFVSRITFTPLLSARQAITHVQVPLSKLSSLLSLSLSPIPSISSHLTSIPFHTSQPSLPPQFRMQKKFRLSLAATHFALCAHILDLLPSLPAILQDRFSILTPWLLALGIPLLILISHPRIPGQFDVMLAWAAGALFISIYRNCKIERFWDEGDGNGEGRGSGMCGNSAFAEVVFVGLSVGMIWKRYW
ncbi:hypothetical protein N431DRAFT_97592 [Stipitochalara longipes BDJ]|nr:hypothetical protein N431DRAFT_97592 [Stipitochalara longipes BDJ]